MEVLLHFCQKLSRNNNLNTYNSSTNIIKKKVGALNLLSGKNVTNSYFSQQEHTFEPRQLEQAFYEYMHLIPDHRGHLEFRNHELGSKSVKNLKIGNVTGGHGYQRFGLKKSQHSFLSLSFTFLSYMNVKQYQKYHQNTRNMKKRILASNIGALPILQECPCK